MKSSDITMLFLGLIIHDIQIVNR